MQYFSEEKQRHFAEKNRQNANAPTPSNSLFHPE
jgi:hypothetical protein